VLPPGCLGERVAGFRLAGLGLVRAEQGGLPVPLGDLILAEVAK
jgi:hypothetical protein